MKHKIAVLDDTAKPEHEMTQSREPKDKALVPKAFDDGVSAR